MRIAALNSASRIKNVRAQANHTATPANKRHSRVSGFEGWYYTTPADIMNWNAASDDWHTTKATVDLREGGAFSSRMEAKDGSMGFDFAGTYTKIVEHKRIEYAFGDRKAEIEFTPDPKGVTVRVTF